MSGSWDAMLEDEQRISSQAGLASIRAGSELQRRRALSRLTRVQLIDAVIEAEGLIDSVPTTEHEVGGQS